MLTCHKAESLSSSLEISASPIISLIGGPYGQYWVGRGSGVGALAWKTYLLSKHLVCMKVLCMLRWLMWLIVILELKPSCHRH